MVTAFKTFLAVGMKVDKKPRAAFVLLEFVEEATLETKHCKRDRFEGVGERFPHFRMILDPDFIIKKLYVIYSSWKLLESGIMLCFPF